MCFEEQLNLDYLDVVKSILGVHWQGIPCTHKFESSALTHSQQRSDVIRVLMRDYSDITGTAAKLNLLASPCAWGALELELCAHVWCVRALCSPWGSASSYRPCIHLTINVSIKKLSQFARKTVYVMSIAEYLLWCFQLPEDLQNKSNSGPISWH